MSKETPSIPVFKPGDIVYFYFLHLNTAKLLSKEYEEYCKKGHVYFKVESKSRPMLIISDPFEERSMKYYRVLPFTSRPLSKRTRNWLSFGKLIDPDKDSYLILNQHCYPVNLVDRKTNNYVVKQLDPLDLGNIEKFISSRNLGYR